MDRQGHTHQTRPPLHTRTRARARSALLPDALIAAVRKASTRRRSLYTALLPAALGDRNGGARGRHCPMRSVVILCSQWGVIPGTRIVLGMAAGTNSMYGWVGCMDACREGRVKDRASQVTASSAIRVAAAVQSSAAHVASASQPASQPINTAQRTPAQPPSASPAITAERKPPRLHLQGSRSA